MPRSRGVVVADAGVQFPSILTAAALGTDGSGTVIAATIPTVNLFSVDGGSPTTPGSYVGTLRVDFGGVT